MIIYVIRSGWIMLMAVLYHASPGIVCICQVPLAALTLNKRISRSRVRQCWAFKYLVRVSVEIVDFVAFRRKKKNAGLDLH